MKSAKTNLNLLYIFGISRKRSINQSENGWSIMVHYFIYTIRNFFHKKTHKVIELSWLYDRTSNLILKYTTEIIRDDMFQTLLTC